MRETRSIGLVVVATCLLCLTRPSLSDVVAENSNNAAGKGSSQDGPKTKHEDQPAAPVAVAASPKNDVANPNINSDKKNNNNNNDNTAAAVVDAKAKSGKAVVTSNEKSGKAVVTSNEKSDKSVVTSNEKSNKAAVSSKEKPQEVKTEAAGTESTSKVPEFGIGHTATLNSGALTRGFYVFVGLSVLALAYMVFRSFRLNKSRTQMVRKYGVLAHKQDIEMRPLPLDEDDEDDTTVFDASGLSPPPRSQS